MKRGSRKGEGQEGGRKGGRATEGEKGTGRERREEE